MAGTEGYAIAFWFFVETSTGDESLHACVCECMCECVCVCAYVCVRAYDKSRPASDELAHRHTHAHANTHTTHTAHIHARM